MWPRLRGRSNTTAMEKPSPLGLRKPCSMKKFGANSNWMSGTAKSGRVFTQAPVVYGCRKAVSLSRAESLVNLLRWQMLGTGPLTSCVA